MRPPGASRSASGALTKGRAGLTLRLLRQPPPHRQKGGRKKRWARPHRDWCRSSLSPVPALSGHKGTTWVHPEHLSGGGRTSLGGMSAALWSSISHLLGGAFPVLAAGLGLGVASEDSPGVGFCGYFMMVVFLQSHSGCVWAQEPGVMVGDNRSVEQPAAVAAAGHVLLQLPRAMPYMWQHSCWVNPVPQCLKTWSLELFVHEMRLRLIWSLCQAPVEGLRPPPVRPQAGWGSTPVRLERSNFPSVEPGVLQASLETW